MASKVFQQIFERHIAQFVGLYSEDSTTIFRDEKSRLIHPGEYGKYREESCKELLRMILGKEVSISDGFVITSGDKISTQCDIIVYNSKVSPFIADGIAKMFPAEEVRMIAEIKSTLSRQGFIDALRKMAENKKMIIDGRSGDGICPHGRTSKMYDTVISFLICNKLDFAFDKLMYDEVYSGIDRVYWHNSILSVEDATLSYALKFSDFLTKSRKSSVRIESILIPLYLGNIRFTHIKISSGQWCRIMFIYARKTSMRTLSASLLISPYVPRMCGCIVMTQ